MKTKVTISTVIEELKVIFNIGESSSSIETDGSFLIGKRDFTRDEVIGKLQEYFGSRVIDGGACSVAPITFVFTSFEILTLDKLNEEI